MQIEMTQSIRAAALAALVLLVGCQLDGRLVSAKSSLHILDESYPLEIEAIARVMCEPKSKGDEQISRLSTVDSLVEFFEQQVSGESHALFKCKQQHGETLRQLQKTFKASKQNGCSDEKLALIEDFHNKFVSRLVEHKKSREEEQREAAPQLLRLLFIQYALEVDVVCKQNLVKNFEWSIRQTFGDDINKKLFEFEDQSSVLKDGTAFRRALHSFTKLFPVNQCKDVLMVWDMIENSHMSQKLAKSGVTIEDEIDPQTGEPIRMMVKIRSSGPMNAIKDHCHYNLKPIYSKLILPVIKLADLGYSNNAGMSDYGRERMLTSEHVKRWSSVTQFCEAILPIKYLEDPSLGPEDMVVITKQEANELEKAGAQSDNNIKPKVQLVFEPDTNTLKYLDRLLSVGDVEPRKLVKRIKSNAEARRHVIGRTVMRLLLKLKSSLKHGRAVRIRLSKPTGKGRSAHLKSGVAEEELDEQLMESLGDTAKEGCTPTSCEANAAGKPRGRFLDRLRYAIADPELRVGLVSIMLFTLYTIGVIFTLVSIGAVVFG